MPETPVAAGTKDSTAPKLLVLDDEPDLIASIREVTRHAFPGIDMEGFTEPKKALRRLQEKPFDVVLCDFLMPGMNGADFINAARAVQPRAFYIIVSGLDENVMQRSKADLALLKPLDPT